MEEILFPYIFVEKLQHELWCLVSGKVGWSGLKLQKKLTPGSGHQGKNPMVWRISCLMRTMMEKIL